MRNVFVCIKCGKKYRIRSGKHGQTCKDCGTRLVPEEQTTDVTVQSDADAASLGATVPENPTGPDRTADPISGARIEEVWGDTLQDALAVDATLGAQRGKPSSTIASRMMVRPMSIAESGKSPDVPHYEILDVLGQGGMGVVYTARQTSIARRVALKTIKANLAKEVEHRNKFLAEAAVTGDLDHPNIVPIHDLGSDAEGNLFYSMRQVRGVSWKERIKEMSETENIQVLMDVADATAFAHSRGVVHRDLKPENIMLGDFGEVLVMDWGLAVAAGEVQQDDEVSLALAEKLTESNAVGGTPAYMAPEMALGDPTQIGTHSDVYLLGAILYEILTGCPPHTGSTVMQCLIHAGNNELQPTDRDDELVHIATKAMATEPSERYPSVKHLQERIREYQEHAESIALYEQARAKLKEAKKNKEYDLYARALIGFEEAVNLWAGNKAAAKGIIRCQLAYATLALEREDFDLAESLLSDEEAKHAELLGRVRQQRTHREAKLRRSKLVMRIAGGLIAAAVLAIVGASVWVQVEQARAQAARKKSAPAFLDRARKACVQKDWENAILDLSVASDYDPDLSDVHMLRAQISIVQGEFDAAEQSLRSFLQKHADEGRAKQLLALCEDVQTEPSQEQISALGQVLLRQGAMTFAHEMLGALDEFLSLYRERIEGAWPGMGAKLKYDEEGQLSIHLPRSALQRNPKLKALRGMPLQCVSLGGPVEDLSPLEGMELVQLYIQELGSANSLAPLQGMPLKSLYLRKGKGLLDLTALKNSPLEDLSIIDTLVEDLSPLAGMPLRELEIVSSKRLSDLSPLQGMPLRFLKIRECKVSDIEPLREMPVEKLDLHGNPIEDLSPLEGMQLKEFHCTGRGIESISVLRGMPMEMLVLNSTMVADLYPLAGMPLRVLDLYGCKEVSSLSPLTDLPITDLRLEGCTGVVDVTPLRTLPLEKVHFEARKVRKGAEHLRSIKSLAFIRSSLDPPLPAEAFWKWYDEEVKPALIVEDAMEAANPGLSFDIMRYPHPKELAPDFIVEDGKLVFLTIWHENASYLKTLKPLEKQPLRRLVLELPKTFSDFSPLKTMPLEELVCFKLTKMQSTSLLKSLPSCLRRLRLGCEESMDLRGLAELKDLEALRIGGQCSMDLSFLGKMHITELSLTLWGMDLTSLEDLRLKKLSFLAEHVKRGLSAILKMKSLEGLALWPRKTYVSPEVFWKKHPALLERAQKELAEAR